jgi:class 3 adenylate cyclase
MSATLGLSSGAWAVLFTDVAGSTALRVRVGDDQADRIFAAHDRLVRATVFASGGLVVKSTGDGVMAAFRSAAQSVAAAVRTQQEVAGAEEPQGAGLQVRIGISLGDIALQSGDLYGIAVVEAARLCEAAEPGEILISETARRVAGTRGGYEFVPRGPLALKGLDQPVSVFAVPWSADRDARAPPQVTGLGRAGLPGSVPVGAGPFVGRHELLAALEDAWHGSEAGVVQMVVAGPAGIGKTALVAHFAEALRERGTAVLWGACDSQMMLPLQPWIEALRPVAASVAHRLGPLARDLALVLPLPGIEPRAGGLDETLRHRLCEAVLAVLVEVGASGRLCLVLDDLHWADPLTLTMIRFVHRHGSDLPLLLLGLTRDDAAASAARLNVEPLEIAGLAQLDIAELVSRHLPSTAISEAEIARLMHTTGGNPFFITEMIRAVSSGTGRFADLLAAVPDSVQVVLDGRLQELTTSCRELLTVASVIGEEFAVDDLAVLVNASSDTVVEVLQDAVDRSVIAETAVLDRFRFNHDLVRRHLLDTMTASRRARLHRAVADLQRGDAAADAVVQRAEHLLAAQSLVEIEDLTAGVLTAGEVLEMTGGFEQAATLYGEAREVAHRAGDEVAEARLAAAHGKVLAALEQPLEAQEALDRAAALARSLEVPSVVVETARALYVFDPQLVPPPDQIDVLRRAVRLLEGDISIERVQALTQLSFIEFLLGNRATSARLLDEADRCAEGVGTAAAHVEVSHMRHLTGRAQGEPVTTTVARTRRAIDVAAAAGDARAEARARGELVTDALEACDLDLARAAWVDYAEIVEQTRDPEGRWIAATGRALIEQAGGDLDESDRLAAAARELGNRLDIGTADVGLGSHLFVSSWLRGTLATLVDHAEAFASVYPDLPIWSMAVGLAKAEAGDQAGARRALESVREREHLVEGYLRPATLVLGAEAAVLLDDRERAEVLRDELTPFRDRCIVVGFAFALVGPARRPLGLIESLIDAPADGLDLLVDTARWCRAGGMHAWADRSLRDASAVARRHGLSPPPRLPGVAMT